MASSTGTSSTGHDVMISYQWDAQDRMILLKQKLEAAGLSVWMDVEQIVGNVYDRMAEAVEGSKAILICFSKKYQDSDNCKIEANFAVYNKKRIIPLKYEEHKLSGWLGLLIGSILYYDVSSDEALDNNCKAIVKAIKGQQAPPTQPIPVPPIQPNPVPEPPNDDFKMAVSFEQVEAILLESTPTLSKYLRPDGILLNLKAARAITPAEDETIKGQPTNPKKMEKLLDILRTSPVESYKTFMRCLEKDRKDLYTYVKGIEDKHCATDTTPVDPPIDDEITPSSIGHVNDILTDPDFQTIAGTLDLTRDQLTKLYRDLGLTGNEIQSAETRAHTDDLELRGVEVLKSWRQMNGEAATKGAILRAMGGRKDMTEAMQSLKKTWQISSI